MRNEKGFTLVELLAAIGAGIIMLAAIYTAVTFGYRSSVAVERKVTAVEDARTALELMSAEIRMASYNPMFASNMWRNPAVCNAQSPNQVYRGIQEATANSITIQMDINEDADIIGDLNEIIRYVYIPGPGEERITRDTNCTGGMPFLGATVASGTPRTVLVRNTAAIPVFRYFNGRDVEILPGTNPALIPDIRRIDITLVVDTEFVDPNTNQRRRMIYSTSDIPRNHAPVF
jgi:type II secretory pathway pseudopilin PulG